MGRQLVLVGFNLICNFDLICLVVYTTIAFYFLTSNSRPLQPIDIIYLISFYGKICKMISDLTGPGYTYIINGLISLKRIEVIDLC
jgi:hypothetical protein